MPRVGNNKTNHGGSLGEATPHDKGFNHLVSDRTSPRVATLRGANLEDVAKVMDMDMDLRYRRAREKQMFQLRCPRPPCHGLGTLPWAR